VDVTFGGESFKRILSRLGPGKLFAFDQDQDASNTIDDDRFVLIENFRFIKRFLRFMELKLSMVF
jgi:16S rRNA (cytosine1402-N4)-methyltransferase